MITTPLIRRATVADLESIFNIWLTGTRQATGHFLDAADLKTSRDFFEGRLSSLDLPFGFWVAVTETGQVIGWQALQPFGVNPLRRPREAGSSTYTLSGSGYGRVGHYLLQYAMEQAKASNLELIWGETLTTNRASIRMMLAAGWKKIGTLPAIPRSPEFMLESWVYCVPR